jgi:hypothetical protein
MEISPPPSIPSSPIKNLHNERKRLESKIRDINKDIDYFKDNNNPEMNDLYSDMLKFSENEKNRNIDLLNKINTEISNADKISPLNKKKRTRSRSRSNGGTIKKTRQKRRKSVRRR